MPLGRFIPPPIAPGPIMMAIVVCGLPFGLLLLFVDDLLDDLAGAFVFDELDDFFFVDMVMPLTCSVEIETHQGHAGHDGRQRWLT